MSEQIRENEEMEATSVEIENDVDDSDGPSGAEAYIGNARDVTDEVDQELDNYSDSVQRRINQLTAKRKQAAEEAAAAYQYAEQVRNENEQMKRRLQQMSVGYNKEAEGRLDAQEIQATKAYAEANEAGDYERAAKAQQALAKIAVAKEKVRSQKQKLAREQEQAKQQQQYAEQQQQYAQQQQQYAPQQQPQRDEKLESWLEKNKWFGSDRLMTRAAQAIHEQLVLEEDFDPRSDDYYKEIDSRMRKEMPHKFKEKRSNAQTVAPASPSGRSQKSGRKKAVELTPGQVAFAKKMRIPLEKYAQEVAKLDRRD